MLEWYRPHYDMYRLMNEVDDLLQQVLDCPAAESLSYQQALRYLEIDPPLADKTQLREVAAKLDLSNVADTEEDRDTLLQLLFTFGVEPNIGKEKTDLCVPLSSQPGITGANQYRRSSGR